MEVSNPRDDRAERNRGSAGHPEGWKLPSRKEHHIRFFFLHNNPQIWFISRFCVFFGALSLGENTWVRCNFITQAKSVAISDWCARTIIPYSSLKLAKLMKSRSNQFLEVNYFDRFSILTSNTTLLSTPKKHQHEINMGFMKLT